jgi:hypothetical protein
MQGFFAPVRDKRTGIRIRRRFLDSSGPVPANREARRPARRASEENKKTKKLLTILTIIVKYKKFSMRHFEIVSNNQKI